MDNEWWKQNAPPVRIKITAYDKAKWHFDGDYPKDLPIKQAYVHTGMYLGWLIDQGLFNEAFAKDYSNNIREFCNRKITGPQLFEAFDGVLASDMLNEQGNQFTLLYFDVSPSEFIRDYQDLLVPPDLPSSYHVKDTWENYNRLKERIDERFRKWKLDDSPVPKAPVSDASKQELFKALVAHLEPALGKYGFNRQMEKEKWAPSYDVFGLPSTDSMSRCLEFENINTIYMAVRIEPLEKLLYQCTTKMNKYSTEITKRKKFSVGLTLNSGSDIETAAERFLKEYAEEAIPYFDQFSSSQSSLERLDTELNTDLYQGKPRPFTHSTSSALLSLTFWEGT